MTGLSVGLNWSRECQLSGQLHVCWGRGGRVITQLSKSRETGLSCSLERACCVVSGMLRPKLPLEEPFGSLHPEGMGVSVLCGKAPTLQLLAVFLPYF